ncbi:MAG: hypothetical protein KGY81_10310, partial [Phycisphaerae bacterium]|nr:hypothetical protein [Phycisphaerae bacterium]
MGQSPASKDGDPPRAENNGDLLDHAPPQIVFERHFELRRLASVLILGLFTAVLLIVSFPPFDLWWVGYVALVPWTLAVVGGRRGRLTVLIAWATALVYWACALYWLMLPTVVGALATMIYLSLYWLLAAVVLRRALRRGWPAWGVMPVVWVGIEFLQSRIISGFPWFFLAQSQWTRTRLIQVADITGQYGVSFLVAMVNGLLVDMLTAPLLV